MKKKHILYILYSLAALSFFLYYLFPSAEIGKFIEYKVRTANPAYSVTIGTVSPAFPPGILLHPADAYEGENLLIETDKVKIYPGILSLFGSEPLINFQASLYEGTAEGHGIIKQSPEEGISVEARFSGIRMKQITALQNMSAYQISGILGGDITYSAQGASANGESSLKIKDLNVELGPAFISLGQLTFTDADAKLNLQNSQNLVIQECTAKGKQMGLELSGTVTLKNPPEKSQLNLSGAIRPHPELIAKLGEGMAALLFKTKPGKSEFPFKIRGTLEKPDFSVQ